MPKRGADNQITKDNHEDQDEEDTVTGEQKLASDEKLAQRKIMKVKRKVTTGESEKPAGMPTFTFADDSKKPASASASGSGASASASASASGSGAAAADFDASKPVANSFAAFLPKADEWECPDCFVRNKAGDSKCKSCTAPNPNAAGGAAGGKSAEENAVADAGISFGGGGASSSAPVTSEAIFGSTAGSSFGSDAAFSFGGGDNVATFGAVADSGSNSNALDKAAETEATGAEEPNPAAAQFVGKKAEGSGEENDQLVHTAKCRVYILKTVEKKDVKESQLPRDDDDNSSSASKPASNGAAAGSNGNASASASGSGKVETEQKYVEVGGGDLRINRFTKPDGSKGARMVLRAEKTQRLVVNAPIFEGMSFAIQQDKYVRFISLGLDGADSAGAPKMQAHLLRFKSKSEASDVHANIATLVAEVKKK